MTEPKRILITGASSGIGSALAAAYARPGVSLFLSGQNLDRMRKTELALSSLGADISFNQISVDDQPAMEKWIGECAPLDLVIANAGIAGDASVDPFSDATAYRDQLDKVFTTNVSGVFNTVLPSLPLMKKQGYGQIAVVSSLAGFRGMPSAGAYCASKAAVRSWVEALRPEAADEGIKLNLICPGFVRSRITDKNVFKMPFFMEGDKAANRIKAGLKRNQGRIAFPLPMYFGAVFLDALPNWLAERLTNQGRKKFNKRQTRL